MSVLDSRLCDLLGIDKPIVLAPMVAYSDGVLAAAVSEAGGLGTFGAWSVLNVDQQFVIEQLAELRGRTARPFGVGFICSAGWWVGRREWELQRDHRFIVARLAATDTAIRGSLIGPAPAGSAAI